MNKVFFIVRGNKSIAPKIASKLADVHIELRCFDSNTRLEQELKYLEEAIKDKANEVAVGCDIYTTYQHKRYEELAAKYGFKIIEIEATEG